MSDDPHDPTVYSSDWDQHLSKPPRHVEDHDQHWHEPTHWRITPWIVFWAFVGGAMWASIIYSAYLIYLNT